MRPLVPLVLGSVSVAALGAGCGGKGAEGGGAEPAAQARPVAPAAEEPPARPLPSVGPVRPSRPLGSYRSSRTVKVACEDPGGCTREVVETLVVKPASGGRGDIHVDIELLQESAHTCSFDGRLIKDSPTVWIWRAPADQPPCELRLLWSDETLVLESDGCRQFCGARASLIATWNWPPDPAAESQTADPEP